MGASVLTRIVLVLTNLALLLVSAALIAVGVIGYKGLQSQHFFNLNFGAFPAGDAFKPLYLATIILGCWFALNGLFGCFGALTRKNRLLGFFIFLLVLDILAIAGGGAYAFIRMRNFRSNVDNVTRQEYVDLKPAGWLVVQNMLTCCGFTKGDLSTTTLTNGTLPEGVTQEQLQSNPCTTAEVAQQIQGCLPAAQSFVDNVMRIFTATWAATGAVLLFTIILAAVSMKHRRKQNADKGKVPEMMDAK